MTTYHSLVHEGPRAKVWYNSVMVRGDAVIANSEYTGGLIRRVHGVDDARLRWWRAAAMFPHLPLKMSALICAPTNVVLGEPRQMIL